MIKRGLVYVGAALGLLLLGVLALGFAANFLVSIVAFWMSLPLVVQAAGAVVGPVAVLVLIWAGMKRRR